tara:strand:- start:255 stop:842 length:588 start_codon:yes stop_codon:yes gene_type:complete
MKTQYTNLGKPAKKLTRGEPHQVNEIDTFYRDKFWDMVSDQSNPTVCWEHQGNTQNTGYVNWWYRSNLELDLAGKQRIRYITAHRFSALINFGNITNDYCVLHKCDNRICVNPNHLFLGSQLDNIRDMWNKGRQKDLPILQGADNYNAKLTEPQVKAIIANKGKLPQRKLAELYAVSTSTIERIHMNISWRHIPR